MSEACVSKSSEKGIRAVQNAARYAKRESSVKGAIAIVFIATLAVAALISENKLIVLRKC
jgi:hypothetical protein